MQLAATQERWKEKMFGAAAACRDKHRLQPGEPKPRPAEARRHSPRGLRHENNTAPTEAELANLQRTLSLNARTQPAGVSPAKAEAASLRAGRLRLAQFCELQNRQKPAQNNRKQTTIPNPPRHYVASGLLNLLTTLIRTMIRTTQGVKLPEAKIKQK